MNRKVPQHKTSFSEFLSFLLWNISSNYTLNAFMKAPALVPLYCFLESYLLFKLMLLVLATIRIMFPKHFVAIRPGQKFSQTPFLASLQSFVEKIIFHVVQGELSPSEGHSGGNLAGVQGRWGSHADTATHVEGDHTLCSANKQGAKASIFQRFSIFLVRFTS